MAWLVWCALGWHRYGAAVRERHDVVLRDVVPASGLQRTYCAVYERTRCVRCGAVRETCTGHWIELHGGALPNGTRRQIEGQDAGAVG